MEILKTVVKKAAWINFNQHSSLWSSAELLGSLVAISQIVFLPTVQILMSVWTLMACVSIHVLTPLETTFVLVWMDILQIKKINFSAEVNVTIWHDINVQMLFIFCFHPIKREQHSSWNYYISTYILSALIRKLSHIQCTLHSTCIEKCDTFLFITDVNECETENGGCAHSCFNYEGGFNCSCDVGYVLSANESDCIGKSNIPYTCVTFGCESLEVE